MTYQIQKLLSRVFAGSNSLIITEFEPDMKISTLLAMFNQQYAGAQPCSSYLIICDCFVEWLTLLPSLSLLPHLPLRTPNTP